MGGNRQTGYNWENNASNAGSDYEHQSDEWPCTVLGYKDCGVPGAQFIDFAKENKTLGAETLATIPIVDYVAADKNKKVLEADKAPSARWVKSIAKKPGALSLTPEPRRQDRLPGRVRQPDGQQAGQGVRRRHQVLLARQRAGAVAEHAPAHPPGADPLRRDGEAHRGGRHRGREAGPERDDAGGGRLRLVGVHVAVRGARLQGAQREVRHLPGVLPGVDEGAGDEAQEAPGARAGRALVSGGARHEAHHGEGHVAQDGRGAAAGAAQPLGSDLHREELDHRAPGASRSG